MVIYNKKDLVKKVAEKLAISKKEAALIVDAIFETISETLVDSTTVDIARFGKFEIVERGARMGMNPATKSMIEIPATKSVKFKPAKVLKEQVKH